MFCHEIVHLGTVLKPRNGLQTRFLPSRNAKNRAD